MLFSGLRAVLSADGFQTNHFRAVLRDLGIECTIVGGEDGSTLYMAQQSDTYEVYVPDGCLKKHGSISRGKHTLGRRKDLICSMARKKVLSC